MKQTIRELSSIEASKARRAVDHVQKALQIRQFIENGAWAYRQELIDLVDREVDTARTNWDTIIKSYGLERDDNSVEFNFDLGLITREIPDDIPNEPTQLKVVSDDGDSESSNVDGAVPTSNGS